MIYLFLDKNFFIHFKDFDQINWLEYFKCNEITLVIPPIVISELDDKKHDSMSNRTRSRAINAIKKINKYWIEKDFSKAPLSVKDGSIQIIVLSKSPRINKYRNLLPGNNDDEIIASILEFKKNNRKNVKLITDDTGLVIKAESNNINFLRPPKDWSLREEEPYYEKKIKKLEEEIEVYQTQKPILDLEFNIDKFNDSIKKIQVEKINDLRIEHIKETLEFEETQIKITKSVEKSNIGDITIIKQNILDIDQIELIRYQKDCEKYIEDYEKFLNQQHTYRQNIHRTLNIICNIVNSGTCPAINVQIILTFPNDFIINYSFPVEPVKPKKPEKPRYGLEKALNIISGFNASMNMDYLPIKSSKNQEGEYDCYVIIPDSEKNSIKLFCKKVMHNIPSQLPNFFVLLPEDTRSTFNVRFKMHAENLPKPVEKKKTFEIIYKCIYNCD